MYPAVPLGWEEILWKTVLFWVLDRPGAVAGWNEAFNGLHGLEVFRTNVRAIVFQDLKVDKVG